MSTASLFLIYLFRAHARRRMTSSPERERSLAPNLRDLEKKGAHCAAVSRTHRNVICASPGLSPTMQAAASIMSPT